MCGIFGVNRHLDRESIGAILGTLSHRGPDEEGCFTNDNFSLVHNRLKVIDLETGRQPIFNEDNTKCIIFNGEIFNYQELKRDLLKEGHKFKTNTDTEVVLHLFEEKGIDSLSYLNGQFALAILDLSINQIILARDRLGIIPLYYFYNGRDFAFASEISAILKSKVVYKNINKESILRYLVFRYNFGEESIIQGIKRLLPGHYLTFNVDTGNLKIDRFWHLNSFADNKYCCDSRYLQDLVSSSVKYRMISDVPVGVLLSGGLDSSIIAFLMSQNSSLPIKTFSVGFNLDLDETKEAKKIAQFIQSDHTEIFVEPQDYQLLPKIISYFDEPIGDIIILPTYLLAKAAVQRVKVVLSGEGADEIFAGYIHQHFFYYLYRYWNKLPSYLRRSFIQALYLLPNSLFNKLFPYPGKLKREDKTRVLNSLRLVDDPDLLLSHLISLFAKNELSVLLKAEYSDGMGKEIMLDKKYPFRSLLKRDLCNWLPDYTLFKIDRVTMANSLESRTPFLDHRIVEYVWGCKNSDFIRNNKVKIALREAFKNNLPLEVIKQKKKAFYFPYFKIFGPKFKEFLSDLALTGDSEIFEKEPLKKAINLFNNNMSLLDSKKLMSIFILRIWEKYWYQIN